MKKKKLLAFLLAAGVAATMIAAVGCGGGNDPGEQGGDTSTPLAEGKKIYLVGDSTVCSFSDNYYLPRYGYGTQLYNYVNCESGQIVNLALSGRSSKSFLTESEYSTLKNGISSGDYLIIGFGHNDEKSAEPERFTDPNAPHTQATTAKGDSFRYVLYENYVKLAKDAGATPILCTPITRYDASGSYTGSKVHVTADGNYPEAIKTLGAATDTTVIDLTALSVAEYKKDNAAAANYHAHTTYAGESHTPLTGTETPDGRDDTHINKYGAKMVAYQFANAIKSTENPLKAHVKTDSVAPTKDADYADAIKTDYEKPTYEPFDASQHESSILATEGGVNWYKTVMGDVGGNDKVTNFSSSYSEGTFTISNTTGHGKFASGSDGFGAAFVQIDAKKNFTASATVTVKSLNTGVSNQSGFGLMLRDDILIDTHSSTESSNYVVAGALASGGGAIFSRESASLKKNGNNTTVVAADSTYTVSIERIGQTVNVSFADGTNTYTKTYTDFDFVAVDNDYMYLCLVANRGLVCEFSNVQFEITGDSQGA